MKTSLLIASVVLLGLITSSANAGGVPIQYGWGSEIRTVGDVAKDSPLGLEMSGQRLSIAQTWDQFWLAAPMWCSGRKYVVHERANVITGETRIWELKVQSPDEIARLTSIPRSQLSFPWWSYVPSGWLIAAGLALAVRILAGASPKRRFDRLWKDERYRHAVAVLTTPIGSDGDDEEELTAAEVEAEAEANWNEALEYLSTQGISRRTAERRLQFLAGYLRSHPVG
jgi:hypothetical protein